MDGVSFFSSWDLGAVFYICQFCSLNHCVGYTSVTACVEPKKKKPTTVMMLNCGPSVSCPIPSLKKKVQSSSYTLEQFSLRHFSSNIFHSGTRIIDRNSCIVFFHTCPLWSEEKGQMGLDWDELQYRVSVLGREGHERLVLLCIDCPDLIIAHLEPHTSSTRHGTFSLSCLLISLWWVCVFTSLHTWVISSAS